CAAPRPVLDGGIGAGGAVHSVPSAAAAAPAVRRAAGRRLGRARLARGRAMTKLEPRLQSAVRSHVGLVRTLNEDACLARPDLGIWAIADGMGGHDCGDYASNLIIGELGRVRRPSSARELLQAVDETLARCNRALIERAEDGDLNGSTIVTLLAFEQNFAVIWAGDSRLYRW